MTDYHYYDIYGFVIAVKNELSGPYDSEYRRFRVDSLDTRPDLLVRRTVDGHSYPTRLLGDTKGLLLPFDEGENEVLCNEGIDAGVIFALAEPFISWNDKCFMHAGAVGKDGRAMLFPAAQDTGKTSTVLQLLRRSYDYLGDEWVVLDRKATAHPFPKKIHIINHNLEGDKPMVVRAMGGSHIAYHLYRWYFRLWQFLYRRFPVRRFRALLGFFRPVLLHDIQALLPDVAIGQPSSISHVFYLERKSVSDIGIAETSAGDVARRMAAWNQFERREFIKEYYRYASTRNAHNSRIEGMLARETSIMTDALSHARVYRVSLPEASLCKATYQRLAAMVDDIFRNNA